MEQQISIVTVQANTKILIHALRQVEAAVGKRNKRNISSSAEITITDGKITIAVPGAIFSSDCITQGTCKAIVPFFHFMQIIKDLKIKETQILITEGSLTINNVSISVKTTFFENDNILRTIDLPLLYTEADLIRLNNKSYTYEELEFNNLHSEIEKAYNNLDDNIFNAYKLLSQYGTDFSVLKEMVYDKLFK